MSATHYRSLRELVESKTVEGISKTTAFRIDPRLLKIEPGFNARPIDQDHVNAFKISIKVGATIPRLIVKVINGEPVIRDGHHRHAAYMQLIEAGEDIRSVEVDEFKGNDADAIALLLTSAQGKHLTPLQAGTQFAKLMKFGWTKEEIAAKVGRSSTHVAQMLQLTELDSDIQGMVARKEVPATVALAALKEHGGAAKQVLAAAVNDAKSKGKTKVNKKAVSTKKTLAEAIKIEMISGIRAEKTCPQYAVEIAYLRGTKK